MQKFFTDKIESVKTSFPSVYTKEDVINVIEDLYFASNNAIEKSKIHVDDATLKDIADVITSRISECGIDLLTDFNVTINYGREIDIDDISVNETTISDIAFTEMKEYFNQNK